MTDDLIVATLKGLKDEIAQLRADIRNDVSELHGRVDTVARDNEENAHDLEKKVQEIGNSSILKLKSSDVTAIQDFGKVKRVATTIGLCVIVAVVLILLKSGVSGFDSVKELLGE